MGATALRESFIKFYLPLVETYSSDHPIPNQNMKKLLDKGFDKIAM